MFSKSLRGTLISLASLVAIVSATQSLSLKVTGPASVNSVESLKLSTTLTNTGDETLKILNDPRGPLNKMPTDTFEITGATGAQPSFTGIKLKYVPKTAVELGAYTVLAPGESVSINHDLTHTYNFTASGAASYDIHARNSFLVVNDDSTISTLYADSVAHSAHISGKLAVPRPTATLTKRETYVGCTAAEKTSLVAAASAAQAYAASASSYASSNTASTTRYTTWFGTYTTARHTKVVSQYTAISGNDFSSFTFDCTCTEADTYAYVYPDSFGEIYLCGAFWDAPTKGTDSKGGTIIHESSHFTVNGATLDNAYGQTACKALAKSDPASAVDNADSHEYFAENNPALA